MLRAHAAFETVVDRYLNVINPVDVAFGEGLGTDAARWMGDFLSDDPRRGCLAEPSAPPVLPQDDLRSRP